VAAISRDLKAAEVAEIVIAAATAAEVAEKRADLSAVAKPEVKVDLLTRRGKAAKAKAQPRAEAVSRRDCRRSVPGEVRAAELEAQMERAGTKAPEAGAWMERVGTKALEALMATAAEAAVDKAKAREADAALAEERATAALPALARSVAAVASAAAEALR